MAGARVSPEEFRARFASLIEASGLSGRELARRAVISNSTLNGWLRGSLPKDADELRRVVEECLAAAGRRRPATKVVPWDTVDRWTHALALAVQHRDATPAAALPDGSHFTASRRGIDTPTAGGLRVWVWLRSAAGLAASRPRRGRAIS